jgi:hypothetical protein
MFPLLNLKSNPSAVHIQVDSKSYGQNLGGCWGDNLVQKMETNCYKLAAHGFNSR